MDLKSAMDSIKSGASLSNPISSQLGSVTSSISSLASSPVQAIRDLATSMQTSMAAASKAATDVMGSLQTRLPLMKAADNIAAKMNLTQIPSIPTGPGPAFTSVFGPLDAAKSQMASLQSSLTPSVLAKLNSGDTSVVAGLSTQASTMNNSIAASVTSATSAATSSIGDLKAFAFAKFCSMPQPPHVQNIIDNYTTVSVNKELARADNTISTKLMSAPAISSTPLTSATQALPKAEAVAETPKTSLYEKDPQANSDSIQRNIMAIGYSDPTNYYSSFKTDYFTYMNGLSEAASAERKIVDAKKVAMLKWRDDNLPDYMDVKAAASSPGDEASKAKYEQYKQRYHTEGGLDDYNAAVLAYEPKRQNVVRLDKQYTNWVINGFEGVFAGPPW